MKSLKNLAVVAIFGALACAGLHAQSVDMQANIPFDFRAGDKLMPAGEYIVHGDGPWVVLRSEESSRPAALLMTIGVIAYGDPRQPRLRFNRYGNEYFLSAIWDSYSENGRQLLKTARQKELAKRGDVPAPAAVAMVSSK
jgi:hypothetical protein